MTIVDKTGGGRWTYYEDSKDGFKRRRSQTEAGRAVLPYSKRLGLDLPPAFARRGLSPGSQRLLTFTEAERVRLGLRTYLDVVPCVTTLRAVHDNDETLDQKTFGRLSRPSRTTRRPGRSR